MKMNTRKWIAVLLACVMGLLPVMGLAEGIIAKEKVEASNGKITVDGKLIEGNTIEEVNIVKNGGQYYVEIYSGYDEYDEGEADNTFVQVVKSIKIVKEIIEDTISKITVSALDGFTSSLEVGQNIELQGKYADIDISADGGSTTNFTVGGDVSLRGEDWAYIEVTACDESNVNFTVGGNITAEYTDEQEPCYPLKIITKGDGNTVTANVQGSLNAKGKDVAGLYIDNVVKEETKTPSSVFVNIGDGITSDGYGIALFYNNDSGTLEEYEASDPNIVKNTVIVNGDVTGKIGAGVAANTPFTSTVVIDGVLSGGIAPVALGKKTDDNLKLAAWKIEPAKEGDYAGAYVLRYDIDSDTKEVKMVRDEKAEKDLLYVIRVMKAPDGAGELYTDADILEGYYVAHAGEQVHLLGDKLINGYQLVAAYWGENEPRKEMIKDGDNSFGMTVPVGGGVTMYYLLQQNLKPKSMKPEYHVKYQEPQRFDVWIPVN